MANSFRSDPAARGREGEVQRNTQARMSEKSVVHNRPNASKQISNEMEEVPRTTSEEHQCDFSDHIESRRANFVAGSVPVRPTRSRPRNAIGKADLMGGM